MQRQYLKQEEMKRCILLHIIGFLLSLSAANAQSSIEDIDALEKKAYSGDPEACFKMGRYYEEKSKQNSKWEFFAQKFYSDAALKGHDEGTVKLAQILEKKGPAHIAYEWYQNVAIKGNADALYGLGNCFLKGYGVWPKDPQGAYLLYQMAANLGSQDAQTQLNDLKAQNILAKHELHRKASLGNADAQNKLGENYLNGNGVPKSPIMYHLLNEQAAKQGNIHAMYALGMIYAQTHKYMLRNKKLAQEWLQKAQTVGCPECAVKVGDLFWQYNLGFSSYEYYLYAANQGNAYAQGMMGKYYIQKGSDHYHLETARMWFKKAIAGGQKQFEKTLINDVEYYLHKQELENSVSKEISVGESDVDKDIFVTNSQHDNTFALIIANEKYENVQDVPFAYNDGERMAEYCLKTLGIVPTNVKLIKDATRNDLKFHINRIKQIMQAYKGDAKLLFYYAGHGIPNEESKEGYLLPVDGTSSDTETAYGLKELYTTLNSLPSKATLVLLDACFSGVLRNGEMMDKARGIALKSKPTVPTGNIIVMTASTGDQSASPFEENKHGLFTYYFLKKLQESKGEATLGEIADYLVKRVKQSSLVENGKMQVPTVQSSIPEDEWRSWKLK